MLYGAIKEMRDKADFLRFLRMLARDFEEYPEQWANRTVPDFLEQMAGWIEDFSECPANDIHWEDADYRLFARILYMGKLYE